MSYVLAEYNGETRKLYGDFKKKSYKSLMKDIRAKFDVSQEVEVKVYDKKNGKYFTIDRNEMKEIRAGGMIRVVKRKGSGGKGKKKGRNGGGPMKPPGVPPYSKADDNKRKRWSPGSKVEIFSEGQGKWMKGEIVDIFTDNEGEWLVIKYAGFRTKEIQRFSNYIRPTQPKKKQDKKGKKDKKDTKKKGKNGPEFKKKNETKKDQKPKKKAEKRVTTQSKYKRAPRPPRDQQQAENEVYFTNNARHQKRYIDRACLLLRGTTAGEAPKGLVEDEPLPGAASSASEDDEEIHMVNLEDLKKPPSKTYNVIHLFGAGRAMSAVVTTAEIVKRVVPGLFQVTELENIEVKDVWEPTEQGLKAVETVKNVPRLRITLATSANLVDKESIGFQEPMAKNDFTQKMSIYQEPKAKAAKAKQGGRRGGKGKGKQTKN